jgi:hypothetical protein
MYGMVNKAIEQMVCASHGESVWEAIKAKAEVTVDVFISNEPYDDAITLRLVGAASEILGLPAETVLKAFGRFWVLETAQKSYGPLMQSSGRNLAEFLVNLDHLHTRVQLVFPKLLPPRIECHDVTATTLQLRYFSHRPGLAPFVVGLVEGLGEMFATPAQVEQVGWKGRGLDHDAFLVRWKTAPVAALTEPMDRATARHAERSAI